MADCTQAGGLIEGIEARTLIADKGCDTNAIVAMARDAGMEVVIPSESNRKTLRGYDRYFYKLRHLVESAFPCIKEWRESPRIIRNARHSTLPQCSSVALFCEP